ncbi:MAG TPA: hypothetical protein VHV51_06680, partial [Polyangiaceae bacterium]|nr:hypothetical protein [Polyangiaceae bacterium]
CDQVERDCPSYIRPAGGADCFLYDQASLDGCTALYQSLTTCDEFDQRPCLLIAVSQCGGTGEGGAGGQASVGTGGESASGGETAIGGATSAGASN